MHSTWSQLTIVLIPVVVGAAIGVVPTLLVEWSRTRAELRTRWDASLEEVCADFVATVRQILELDVPADELPQPAVGHDVVAPTAGTADQGRHPPPTERIAADHTRQRCQQVSRGHASFAPETQQSAHCVRGAVVPTCGAAKRHFGRRRAGGQR